MEKFMSGMLKFIEASLPVLQFGVLGLAFLAILTGFFLLFFQPRMPVRRPIGFMLAAAVLMVVSALCRLPDFNAMQRDVADLRGKVNDLRGIGSVVSYQFKQGSSLSTVSYAAHKMEGACGPNPSVRAELNVLVGHLQTAEQRLNAIDDYADRLSRMLSAFQNPFK